MNFTVTNIVTQRSLDGETTYYGASDDKVAVQCTIPNRIKVDEKLLHDKFTSIYESLRTDADMVKIGDRV